MIISHDLFSAMLSYDRKKGLLNYSPDRYVKKMSRLPIQVCDFLFQRDLRVSKLKKIEGGKIFTSTILQNVTSSVLRSVIF